MRRVSLIAGAVAGAVSLAGCGNGGTTTVTVKKPVAAPASAGAVQTPTAAQEQRMRAACGNTTCVDFQTPSTNIKCLASRQGIGCDIASGLTPTVSASKCPAGFGDVSGWGVGGTGTASLVCHTDVPPDLLDRHIPTLAYGRVWHGFGVWCVSQQSGILCLNADSHGFFLSRERWATF